MKKVIIIGAGVSGLSAGINLLRNGFSVTVYDQMNTTGGNLLAWNRQGFTIDNCIHWLTGTNENTKTFKNWQNLGAFDKSKVYNAEYLYKSELLGNTLALYYDIEKTRSEMLNISPSDKKEINDFINAINLVKSIAVTPITASEFLKKLPKIPLLLKYYRLNLFELASKFNHPLIKRFLTDYIHGVFSALALIITSANFSKGNAGIPYGGSKLMAKNIADTFINLGGNIVLGEKAVSTEIENKQIKKITFASGKTAYADYFIFSGDVINIYNRLLKVKIPNAISKRYNNYKLERFSSIHTAFAVDTTLLPFKNTYISDVLPKHLNVIKDTRLKLKEYSYDDSFLVDGKTVIQTITFTNKAMSRYYIKLAETKQNYQKFKTEYLNAVKQNIEETFPTLKGNITALDCWTPYTYKRYTGASLGEYMSFSLPERFIPTTYKNTVKRVKNAVIASQWLTVPGGLPNALNVGINACNTVIKLNKKQLKYKSHVKAQSLASS